MSAKRISITYISTAQIPKPLSILFNVTFHKIYYAVSADTHPEPGFPILPVRPGIDFKSADRRPIGRSLKQTFSGVGHGQLRAHCARSAEDSQTL
jgi:hypothetical protein